MSQKENIMEMAADVVAAYVSNNQLDPAQLPDLLQSVYTGMLKTITKVGRGDSRSACACCTYRRVCQQ